MRFLVLALAFLWLGCSKHVPSSGPGHGTEIGVWVYETFPPEVARRIARRIEFHFTPKHASWLNMVEIEIGVLVRQCLDRRIPTKAQLASETAHWEARRNAEGARIEWLFTVERARAKLGRAYPLAAPPAVKRAA